MSVVEGLPFAEDKKTYILDVLDPILEEMVDCVLAEMPKSPMDFMIAWLRKRSGAVPATRMSMAEKNTQLRHTLHHIKGCLQETGQALGGLVDVVDQEEEESHDEDDGEEIPESFKQREEAGANLPRKSVSAEAYGKWNVKKAIKPPEYPKSDEQKERLKRTLLTSFLFAVLEPGDLEIVLMAMKEVKFAPGQRVIAEGEDGDYLFVVETGTVTCSKMVDGEEQVVKTCGANDVFGELALLYNCPRAATVVAKEHCTCWQLDRESFNHIVKDAAIKRRETYRNFLKSVALISSLDDVERSQIADALVPETFECGAEIVLQDEPGDKFYIVEDGMLHASKMTPSGPKKVYDYKAGDYFGELALLKNQPRAASVIVDSKTARVLSMTRASFNKMLGPLHELLRREVQMYAASP